MLKESPSWYWKITWRFLSPLCMLVLFVASIVALAIKTPQYKVYNAETGTTVLRATKNVNSRQVLQNLINAVGIGTSPMNDISFLTIGGLL